MGCYIRDDSLDKVFKKNSFVLVDTQDTDLGNGRFMCLLVNQKIEIKFVSMQSVSTLVLSAADKENLIPPLIINHDQFQVIGAVIWHSEQL